MGIAVLLFQATGDPPLNFTWVAIGWAVGVTTAVSGMLMSGKLVLGRELEAAKASGAREVDVYKALYNEEKARKETVQTSLDETNNDLRLQNRTLAATVEALQLVAIQPERKL